MLNSCNLLVRNFGDFLFCIMMGDRSEYISISWPLIVNFGLSQISLNPADFAAQSGNLNKMSLNAVTFFDFKRPTLKADTTLTSVPLSEPIQAVNNYSG